MILFGVVLGGLLLIQIIVGILRIRGINIDEIKVTEKDGAKIPFIITSSGGIKVEKEGLEKIQELIDKGEI